MRFTFPSEMRKKAKETGKVMFGFTIDDLKTGRWDSCHLLSEEVAEEIKRHMSEIANLIRDYQSKVGA